MSELIKTLRAYAKAAPLFAEVMEAAADELERKQSKVEVLTEALREIEKRGCVIASAVLIKCDNEI